MISFEVGRALLYFVVRVERELYARAARTFKIRSLSLALNLFTNCFFPPMRAKEREREYVIKLLRIPFRCLYLPVFAIILLAIRVNLGPRNDVFHFVRTRKIFLTARSAE